MLNKILKISALLIGMIYIGAALYLQITNQINMFESIACYAMGAALISLILVFDLWNKFEDTTKQKRKVVRK